MKSSLLIITDRGNLKCYRAEKTLNGRPPRLNLLDVVSLEDGRRKINEVNSDLAGRFSVTDGTGGNGGRHQNSVSERHYEIETDKRICKQLATHIGTILRREQPDCWALAAPGAINEALLGELDPGDRRTIAENVRLDLVHASPEEIRGHFALQPVERAG